MTDVTVTRYDLDTLLAVARLYLDAFTDEEPFTLPEALVYQDVEAAVAKYTTEETS